ncbi:MAG: sulfotransferase family 2 domain-containing protein [Marinomonas sp.]
MPLYINDNFKNILFIHIPKTGGTSIEQSLSIYPEAFFNKFNKYHVTPQHFDREDYLHLSIPSIIEASFCLVRNPLDRLHSEYKYRVRRSKRLYKFFDFESFVYYVKRIGSDNCHLDNHLRSQVDFVFPDTKIYRFEDGVVNVMENVSKDLAFSKCVLGKHEKKSKIISLKRSRQIDEIIYKTYKDDYVAFKYKIVISDSNLTIFKRVSCFLKSFIWPIGLFLMK